MPAKVLAACVSESILDNAIVSAVTNIPVPLRINDDVVGFVEGSGYVETVSWAFAAVVTKLMMPANRADGVFDAGILCAFLGLRIISCG